MNDKSYKNMENKQANEIVNLVESSGLQQQTAVALKDKFLPFFEQALQWKQRAESLVVTDSSQTREMKMAREARLALREIRINADKTRKALKEDSLRYGKAVQGVYNVIEYLIVPIEQHLETQEKFIEIQEAKRINDLRFIRESEISPYMEFVPFGLDYGMMSDEDWEKTINGAKLQMKAKVEAEKKAEEERLAKEKAEAEERDRIKKENERLKAEAEERDRLAKIQMAKIEAEREAAEAKLKAEREAKAKIEAEMKAKIEAENKARAEEEAMLKGIEEARLAEEKKAKAAPDKVKLSVLIANLNDIAMPDCSTDEGKQIISQVKTLMLKLTSFIQDKQETL